MEQGINDNGIPELWLEPSHHKWWSGTILLANISRAALTTITNIPEAIRYKGSRSAAASA
jgi:hypothetical protein